MAKLIKINDLENGMELALPVKNKLGQVLLGRNIRIEQKYKKILITWGIEYVSIKSDEENANLFNDQQIIDAKEKLSERFYWVPRNLYERELFDIALLNILETDQLPSRVQE